MQRWWIERDRTRERFVVRVRSGRRLVISFFEYSWARDVASLLQDDATPDIQGTVGVLTLDDRGLIETAMLGDRTTDDGPGVGVVLGAIALALAGRDPPRRGHFFDARSDLSTDDVARFGAELEAGHAAVSVLGRPGGVDISVLELTELGGRTEVHDLTNRALRMAASRLPIIDSEPRAT